MTDLVGYGSSDEEDSVDENSVDEDRRMQQKSQQSALSVSGGQGLPNNTGKEPKVASVEDDPARPSEAHSGNSFQAITPEDLSGSFSPYTNYCVIIRSLTLPTLPNLDIPQSPPGSPTPGADLKISHFLELKKQDIHFNTKLASSSALKNPSLLPKLMDFAGVGSERQYTTTLPTELWDPAGYPTWAYKEELAEVQHDLFRRKEEERLRRQREGIDFAAAGTPGQPSGLVVPKGSKASAAEMVAALDKERKLSSQLTTTEVRNEVERRDRTNDGLQAGGRSKSLRRRKRSHSR